MSESAQPGGEALQCEDCGNPIPAGRYCGDCLAEVPEESPTTAGGSNR